MIIRGQSAGTPYLSAVQKKEYMDRLTVQLPALRGKARLTQEAVANLAGISRQTYYTIESGKRPMTWNTYLSLIYIFSCIPATRALLGKLNTLPAAMLAALIEIQ